MSPCKPGAEVNAAAGLKMARRTQTYAIRRAGRYAEFVKLGWTVVSRHLYPGERIYTFWKYFRNAFARDAGLRIDHLLLSPSLKNRLVAGGVAREVRSRENTSDHAPAWIELEDIAPLRFRKKARD